MPAATGLHLAAFGFGAILGAGLTAAVSTSKRKEVAPASSPVVQVDAKNRPEFMKDISLSRTDTTVLRHGNPGPIADLLVRKAYVASYDRRLRHPSWTAEHLTLASLGKSRLEGPPSDPPVKGDRTQSTFQEDPVIPETFRARLSDYFRSGYDRGHMVPAADAKMSQEAMNETFLLSNIAPQVGDGFNRHYWAYLEQWCRTQTSVFSDVFVFTIPLYLPKQDPDGKWRTTYEVIGNPTPGVSVPTHFAKVVLGSKPSSPSTPTVQELSLGAFVLPNAPIPDEAPLTSFVVPVDAVERASGLSLFSEAVKNGSKHICHTSKCEVVVRRFDDAQRNSGRKAIGPPK